MTRRIRIPFLADIILVDSAHGIRADADHELLDRGYSPRGPLWNRIIAGRVRKALRVGNTPLPSAEMRGDSERARKQAELADRLDPATAPWNTDLIGSIADYVRGGAGRPVEHLVQELVGRLFKPTYAAGKGTWRAARTLDGAIRSWNPVKRFLWLIGNARVRAQNTLGEASGNDLAAIHATGIAVHNLVESVDRLRSEWANPVRRAGLTPEQAATRTMAGPARILRQAAAEGTALAGSLKPGTLVIFEVGRAAAHTLDSDLAVMSGSWSRCPAHELVPSLLAEIWRTAQAREASL
ncbi:MAG: hypothetical protein OXJ56_21435 [Rhodospirillaceae bacterium]|nr:hypothetical protein [Rhodospirillaceae bacterium]